MKLEWIGHACFRMTAADGTVVITDPYDDSVGIEQVPLEANLITMSHGHHDHCETGRIVGEPVIVRGTEETQVGGVTTRAVASFHDDVRGAKRGPNAIRIFELDGMKVVHMGDQGCMPDRAVLEAISGADVMMMPVGGFYTVDAQGARAILEQTKPRCVIPMHVKTRKCGYPIATVWPFAELMGAKTAPHVGAIDMEKENVPEGVLLMQPLTDTL